jgi:hypothetical protein
MNGRPRVTPGVLGGLVDLVPARLRRRLDAEPDMAEHWSWSRSAEACAVVVSPDVQVLIQSECVSAMDQVSCTCLLAPRCLHIAAVLTRLPLGEQPVSDATTSDSEVVRLTADQRAAAEQARTAAVALLDAGASGAGLLLTSELLRAVHSCREAGLHRAAASGLRVAQRLRDLQAERPRFRLGALAADLADLLSTSGQLAGCAEAQAEWLGTARRAYRPLGSLRVSGLFTEAVLSATGYAGVVTYLCDQNGRVWSLADVTPGPPEQCLAAYAAPIDLGDASVAHRTLARGGLHVQRATASADGRLGAGRGVGAVGAEGCAWSDEPLARLWREPLEEQLDRAWSAQGKRSAAIAATQRAGADLVFLRVFVRGLRGQALELVTDSGLSVSGLAASDHEQLAYRSNLRLLGCAPGLPLLVVGRVVFGRARAIVPLAVAAGEPGALDLPSSMGDRVNLGLDALQHAHVPSASSLAHLLNTVSDDASPDPLDALRRRVYQVVGGGRSAVSEAALGGLARDAAALRRSQLTTAGQILRALGSTTAQAPRGQAQRERLARAWLVAWTYLAAASARLQRLSWTDT